MERIGIAKRVIDAAVWRLKKTECGDREALLSPALRRS